MKLCSTANEKKLTLANCHFTTPPLYWRDGRAGRSQSPNRPPLPRGRARFSLAPPSLQYQPKADDRMRPAFTPLPQPSPRDRDTLSSRIVRPCCWCTGIAARGWRTRVPTCNGGVVARSWVGSNAGCWGKAWTVMFTPHMCVSSLRTRFRVREPNLMFERFREIISPMIRPQCISSSDRVLRYS